MRLTSPITGTEFWIGANDRDTNREGDWRWEDNTPFEYTKWAAGEPNNAYDREDCGAFGHQHSYPRQYWNDAHCPELKPFVCYDMSVEEVMPPKPTFFIPKTPENKDVRGTHWQAEEWCKDYGG